MSEKSWVLTYLEVIRVFGDPTFSSLRWVTTPLSLRYRVQKSMTAHCLSFPSQRTLRLQVKKSSKKLHPSLLHCPPQYYSGPPLDPLVKSRFDPCVAWVTHETLSGLGV